MAKKIVTIIGARPQFIKAAMVSNELNTMKDLKEVIVHTGQHFDKNMSEVFFDQLSIPKPKFNLSISGLSHGAMTGRMLEKIEDILLSENPDLVVVYGDTDSTLAGSLAASKLDIPLAHVEAGLRSRNFLMPEEKNRIVTDCLSQLLFCPSDVAVENLRKENITNGVYLSGDVMYDAQKFYKEEAINQYNFKILDIEVDDYALCTIHRKENTSDLKRLGSILEAIEEISLETKVILPLHPRTKHVVEENKSLMFSKNIKIIEPLPYLDFLALQLKAKFILTDSGGLQKEAFFNSIPCITLRDETEWIETVDLGWNTITGADKIKIIEAWKNMQTIEKKENLFPYGEGNASKIIVASIIRYLNKEA